MARPEHRSADVSTRSRRRTSNDFSGSALPAARMKGASITFADSVKSAGHSSDEEGSRMPYRDRKLSESAISLTGVAEEGPEDESDPLQTPMPNRMRSTVSPSPDHVETRRGSSESEKSTKATPTFSTSSPLARTSSQRRISAELSLGQLPRSVIGSTENLDDYIFPSNGSPSRYPPNRRHSGKIQANLSLFNPSRESLLTVSGQSPTDTEVSPLSSNAPRVPFPRSSMSNSDSPGARRLNRHLSLNAGSSPDSFSLVSSPSHSLAQPSPKIPTRPAYRHMRYSSDLHLVSNQRPLSVGRSPDPSGDERSFISSARGRFDSEMSSLYTNTLGSLTNDENASIITKMSREPSVAPLSKHKLVVVEEGKPNVTYQLGNCIGRGQFGSVYRALNLNSGQMVAVKRIKLEGRSDEDVTQLMNEVDLLKSLTHPSVVKYEGLVRGPEVVSIILEYVENGSLLHTLKAFGNFPEKLVGSYVVKILEGLNYLHEQNVVHCDLKAANILTTKNGNVKLSDFGVSLNLKAVEKMNNKNNDAIGTPNWMAPEVIELKGVTTAADIWSLGCTIIELLTGKPPYYDMLAMSAMFRIVEDDCPPIPQKCSEPLRDLLLQCFKKDPTLRPSAETMFEHAWVRQSWSGNKELRPQDSVPFLRRISADLRRLDPNMFGKDPSMINHPIMERSSSSPPPSSVRPDLNSMRAHTTPTAPVTSGSEPMLSPASSPPTNLMALPNLEGVAVSPVPLDGRSPEGAANLDRALSPLQDPSLLDLSSSLMDEAKPHAFVKSTFSKAVQCKICREPVKKHAVLCEECGLVCHARCAGQAPSPCNLRAQLLLFQHRASLDHPRGVSPAPSQNSGVNGAPVSPTVGSPSSPILSPATFKFPFAIKRIPKMSNAEPPSAGVLASPNSEQSASFGTSPPNASAPIVAAGRVGKDGGQGNGNGNGNGSGQRKRRISLIPIGRHRSPSPPSDLIGMPDSANSSNNALHGVRRHSSISYGSISGSSSISSGGGAQILVTTSHNSSNSQKKQLGLKQVGVSTPHLISHQASHDGHVEPNRFRRRLSSGFPFGHSEVSLHVPGRISEKINPSAGQMTPTPATAKLAERRKSKRTPSKADCVIM